MSQEKNKILVFIDWFLPGYKAGGPVTSISNLVAHLSGNLEFYIITTDTDYLEVIPYPNIKSNVWTDFSDNVKVFYLSKQNLNKEYISKLIKETDFDLAYINGIYSYFFSILPLAIVKKMNKRIIVSARGMLSNQAFSRKSFKKKLFLLLMKIKGSYKGVEFHATNYNEQNDILKIIGNRKISVIPNLARKIDKSDFKVRTKNKGELKLVSIARISQEKNTKFALEVLSKVDKGKITFDIFGGIYDNEYWAECQQIINKLPDNIVVNYKGSVETSKVIDTFENYHFSFMPSIGENFGHSLLESMIAGTPIITSDNTPWRNLAKNKTGWDISLKNIDKFVDLLNSLADFEQGEYDEFQQNSFNYAKQILSNSEDVRKYIKMFNDEQN